MAKFGFWSQVLAGSWQDRAEMRAINEVSGDVSSLHELHSFTSNRITKLYELDAAQGKELDKLRAIIDVLMAMLIESGALDEKTFLYRMEAKLAELEPEPEPVRKKAPAPIIKCQACGQDMPLDRSNVTENGTVCDRCFATMPK